MDDNTLPTEPVSPKPKGDAWMKGCGLGCLGLILIAILATASAAWFGYSLVNDMEDELIAQGLSKQSGHVLKIEETVTEPTYYKAQIVLLRNGSDAPLGLLCQMAELRGEYFEPVTFRGQLLTIHQDAVLHKGLDVTAQMIEQLGKVEGDITGSFQTISETSSFDYTPFENMK
jgi:hypothetical protein